MEPTINEKQAKELFKGALLELIEEKRGLFFERVEEIGLANAIREGRKDQFVGEDRVFARGNP